MSFSSRYKFVHLYILSLDEIDEPTIKATMYCRGFIFSKQSTINTIMNYMIIGPGLLSILSFAIRVTFFNQL